MRDGLDKDLQSIFDEKSCSLTEEPFLGNMMKLIGKRRSRRILMRRLAYVLAFACCACLSPFLIKGSMVMSAGLNVAFAAINSFVSTSLGMSIAILALLFLSARRKRISMHV